MKCAECGAFRNRTWVDKESAVACSPENVVEVAPATHSRRKSIPKLSKSLIAFPSPGRQPIPQWRKELGERVREVQERKAREAILESGGEIDAAVSDSPASARPLELIAKPSLPPTNPLVEAALRRIERAYATSQFSGNTAVATATAYEEQPAYESAPLQVPQEIVFAEQCAAADVEEESQAVPEKTHHLSVVSTPGSFAVEELPAIEESPVIEAPVLLEEKPNVTVKPTRLIRDNDPALNYLDAVPTTVHVECAQIRSAPVYRRVLSALLDLIVAGALAVPVVALVKLTELQWQDPRVITFAAGTFVAAAFLYFTISTALTGRTFAMRLLFIRVVDARTGLIPTGSQSAGRAFIYLLSLATVGVAFMFSFLDREGRTAHDRFTRTAVVRA